MSIGAMGRFAWAVVLLLGTSRLPAAPLQVGVEAIDYYPHYRSDLSGNYKGLGRALLDAFAADVGLTFEYRPRPVPALYQGLIDGSLDFKYPDHPRWAVSVKSGIPITYSAAVDHYRDGLLVNQARLAEGRIRDIGILYGFSPVALGADLDAGRYRLHCRSSPLALLLAVAQGDLDAAYLDSAVARQTLRSIGSERHVVFAEQLAQDRGDYHLSSRRWPQWIARFDVWLEHNATRVRALRREYIGTETPH